MPSSTTRLRTMIAELRTAGLDTDEIAKRAMVARGDLYRFRKAMCASSSTASAGSPVLREGHRQGTSARAVKRRSALAWPFPVLRAYAGARSSPSGLGWPPLRIAL